MSCSRDRDDEFYGGKMKTNKESCSTNGIAPQKNMDTDIACKSPPGTFSLSENKSF